MNPEFSQKEQDDFIEKCDPADIPKAKNSVLNIQIPKNNYDKKRIE
jgi:hypothetical protein